MENKKVKGKGVLERDIPVMSLGYINVFALNEDKFPDKKFYWVNSTEPGWSVAMGQGLMPCREEEAQDVLMIYTHPTLDGAETNPRAYLKRRDMILCWMERGRWDEWQVEERRDLERGERFLYGLNKEAKKRGFADKAEPITNFK